MEGLTPVIDMNNGGFGGNGALGAFGGALVGSWFGDGWRGRGYGYGDGAGVAFGANAVLDAVNGVANSVNQANTANIQGLATVGNTVLTSAFGTEKSIAALQNSNNQGFAGLNTAILTTSYETQRAIDACCCATQKAIIEQGSLTREAIANQTLQATRDKLCETQAKLAQCETLQAVDSKIATATNQIISHVKLIVDASKTTA